MKKFLSTSSLALFSLLVQATSVHAQVSVPDALHVVRSTINADSENGEFCLEFDHALANPSATKLSSAIRLEKDGKKISPPHIEASGSSLCIFPLDRDTEYHLEVSGLHASSDEKMLLPYTQSFTIPDRAPSLAFLGTNEGPSGLGTYGSPLILRSVNVSQATLTVYHVSDVAAMARAWQDRAQTILAPSESVYLAKTKGEQIWQSNDAVTNTPNVAVEQNFILQNKLPQLGPGLYLIVADAGVNDAGKPASKGLAPLAAAWFVNSSFSIRSFRDQDGLHIFSSKSGVGIHFLALNRRQDIVADAPNGTDGTALIAYNQKFPSTADVGSVVAVDGNGNVAFADIENLPPLSKPAALGVLHMNALFAVPGESVDLSLSSSENAVHLPDQSTLTLLRHNSVYANFNVPSPLGESARLSFAAPAFQGPWMMRWQKNDGTLLVDEALRVTRNADAPRLEASADKDYLANETPFTVNVKALTNSGKQAALTQGHAVLVWQAQDPAAIGWKDYHFGTSAGLLNMSNRLSDFQTDLQGQATLHLNVPKAPPEPGLYQAEIKILPEPDVGVASAKPIILPFRPETPVIGVKPLSDNAQFGQNSVARFALICLSSEGKPREISGLSYQIYEEGRSFAWFQDEGHWKYKPEPQLRPIGGGALSIRADAGTVLDWPVTAGNYRLVILDPSVKVLAQLDFSAGWDAGTRSQSPLPVSLPKNLEPGREAQARISLSQPSMVTAIIADQHIRKVFHEHHDKGESIISFVPAADWQSGINFIVDAVPDDQTEPYQRNVIEANVIQDPPPLNTAEMNGLIVAPDLPDGLILRKGGEATINFGIENLSDAKESYRYIFTASTGMKILAGEKGDVTLGGKQSQTLPVTISGDLAGIKDLRLDLMSAHMPKTSRSWTIDVLAKENALHSVQTENIAVKEPLTKSRSTNEPPIAFVAKRSVDGAPEILSILINAEPFTTRELALSIDALRLWEDPLAQAGIASDSLIKGRRRAWLFRLMRRQNDDGGFGSVRGQESSLEDTSSALLALGPDASEETAPSKQMAINWLKQRLSNTWFDEKERVPRAAAYAALAAADAIDPASLHYFSDTSATQVLPAIAEANIAAAFRHIRDPDAAAFWIKKMLDEKGTTQTIPVLDALGATDALSSDDVRHAFSAMMDAIHKNDLPSIEDAAALLRMLAADLTNAGSWTLDQGKEVRRMTGVFVFHPAETAGGALRNRDNGALFETLVEPTVSSLVRSKGLTVSRHIYHLNGGEMNAAAKPSANEIYLVEIKGSLPDIDENEKILLQDLPLSSTRPLGCPLSAKMGSLPFASWFSLHDLTPTSNCELSPHGISAILLPDSENGENSFRAAYFAHIDATTIGDIAAPVVRSIR